MTTTPGTRALILWLPRLLAIAFALFLSVFALDEVGTAAPIATQALGAAIHLVPAALVLLTVILAWRAPARGLLVCVLLACAYVLRAWGVMHWSAYLVIVGPLLVLAALYALGWRAVTGPGAGVSASGAQPASAS